MPSVRKNAKANLRSQNLSVEDFVNEFREITGLRPDFDSEYHAEVAKLTQYLSSRDVRPLAKRRQAFIAHVNRKFRLNSKALAAFYASAAHAGFTFHYHDKQRIQQAFDLSDSKSFEEVLSEKKIPTPTRGELIRLFGPIDEQRTLDHLRAESDAPSKLRIEVGHRDIQGEIAKSQFSAFMWGALPSREMHHYFDSSFDEKNYEEKFWAELQRRSPHLFHRDSALHIVRLTEELMASQSSPNELRFGLSNLVEQIYSTVNNYGFLAIVIDTKSSRALPSPWEVAADLSLFAEKHREGHAGKGYFQWQKVLADTKAYIQNVDIDDGRFDVLNEGFSYRDCFVVGNSDSTIQRLVLVFQKNQRDETPVICPSCRSDNIRGNSYPSLGVRSWECANPLCPDRSKYNRGKRYSFRALVMQEAIDDERSEIPVESVRRWSRDVISEASLDEISEMLLRHYSMFDDDVHVYDWPTFFADPIGRNITHHRISLDNRPHPFWSSALFKRYAIRSQKKALAAPNLGSKDFAVLLGDSATVIRGMKASSIDGAVTSPPYYNAREYSQWPNMYCYLHDMFDINSEVFRVLKPGALYFYNIFDYFDNERTIAMSAMGQRRMILSAYTVDLFRRIGFGLQGCVVWDKGDIQGKRGFNAGNFSPFYQAPFNCWEHVLVFKKPSLTKKSSDRFIYDRILRQSPVIKMVRGENVHGHTAPYPAAIPELLAAELPRGSVILDPFAGSLTTGRAAERMGLRAVCVERSEEYCELGLALRARDLEIQRDKERQIPLL